MARTNDTPKKAAPQAGSTPKKKPASAPPPSRGRRTIAQRTAFRRRNRRTIGVCLTMALFLLAAFVFRFCLIGYGVMALVCAGIAAVIGFYHFIPKCFPHSRWLTRLFTVLLCLGLLVAGVTEFFILRASTGQPDTECDYLLILGAGVRGDGPSLTLRNRIDRAYEYLTAHPDTVAIASGGQGPDEPTSEAQCIRDCLVEMGIHPSRVWLEDKSTSTWENLQFSLTLIQEKTGQRPARLAVLSSEYHMFRASLFTRAAGAEFIGIPARTTYPVLRINYCIREIAGVWHYLILGGQYHD